MDPTITNTSLTVSYSATITPAVSLATNANTSTDVVFGTAKTYTTLTATWSARVISGGGTFDVDLLAGTITPSAAGVLQKETAAVTAAAGATSSGLLPVTITASGSPITVNITLSATSHTTADLIAKAIREGLAANAAVAAFFTVGGTGSDVTLENIYPCANDGTLAITWPAVLGVTAVTSSTNTTAGTAGSIIQRLGGDGLDVNGNTLPVCSYADVLILACSATSTDGVATAIGANQFVPFLTPGASTTLQGNGIQNILNDLDPVTFTFDGWGYIDIIVAAH